MCFIGAGNADEPPKHIITTQVADSHLSGFTTNESHLYLTETEPDALHLQGTATLRLGAS